MIEGKDSRYNCFLISNKLGRRGVEVLLAEKWVDKVFDVNDHQNDCSKVVFTVFLVYAAQTGLTIAEKELFFDSLQNLVQTIDDLETLLTCSDFNGHIGKSALGYEAVHGGYGFGKHNIDGQRILEFGVANNLVVNLTFMKKDNHLTIYQSGGRSSQVDYILLQCNKFHLVKDIKVIPDEQCITQQHLLICNLKLKMSKKH